MKRFWAAIGIPIVATLGCAIGVGTIAWAEGAANDKIFSRQKAFRIPFQIPDPSEQKQLQEVQLYVARDGGKWEKYTTSSPDVPADKRSFIFHTEQDGEYWFAVRTLDHKGLMTPSDDAGLAPGLRVVVDSEKPKINLRPIERSNREVGVEWELQDRNLYLDSLKLEYRAEGEGVWHAVPGVVPKVIGQATWLPEFPGRITVRCQVQDRAQNLGIETIEIDPSATARRSDSGTSTRSAAASPAPRDRSAPLWDLPPARDTGAAATSPGGSAATASPRDPLRGSAAREPSAPNYATDPVPEATPPRTAAPSSPGSAYGSRGIPSAGAEGTMYVKTPDVDLDYEIDDVGPSGVGSVELWITTDQGQTWKPYGEDMNRRPPFNVKLPGDGLYGLTMVAKSGVGLGDRPPAPGDAPQMWVSVDTTLPSVRLLPPQIGKGPDAGSLIIQWSAEDENLSERPVTLYYSDSTSKEWKPIAADLRNTGQYAWKLDSQAAFRGRLRIAIDVVDMAGNLRHIESDDVVIDTAKPRPRMTGVNPSGTMRR
jgi:hypothetical protein